MQRPWGVRHERRDTERDEFVEFVLACGGRLHHAARMLTGDQHAAEDLVQTPLTKVFVSWKKVKNADEPMAYAVRMLHHTHVSSRRLRSSSEVPSPGAINGLAQRSA